MAARILLAFLSLFSFAAQSQNIPKFPEDVRYYSSVGRIKWRLPDTPDVRFGFAVPHFTAGPRIQCAFRGGAECEISVTPRDLTKLPASRQAEFLEEMKKKLPLAKETAVEIRTRGRAPAIHYTTLSARKPGMPSYFAGGYYVKGPAVIWFQYQANTASPADLERIFEVILAAEPLDRTAILAWKLDDYKAICDDAFPELRRGNDAAFALSPYRVDWLALMVAADPSTPRETRAANQAQAKKELRDSLLQGRREDFQRFCEFFPLMVMEAESDVPGGRQRGVIGVQVRDDTEKRSGALVEDVTPGGPAAAAGLRKGDLIVRLDGEEVFSVMDIVRRVAPFAGKRVALTVQRDGQRQELALTVAAAEPD